MCCLNKSVLVQFDSMDDLTERFNAENAIAEIIPELTENVKFFCGDYCPFGNIKSMITNQEQHNALYDTWATLLLLLYCWEKRMSLQKLKMADISLSFLTGLTKEEKRLEKNRRECERRKRPEIKSKIRQYKKDWYYSKRPEIKARQKDYNQRPEIKARKQQPAFKAKNLYRVKKSVANKKQKLAAEKEKNTKIFNQYEKGQNGNLCFSSGKTALAAASYDQTVCVFYKDNPGLGLIFYKKRHTKLKKLTNDKDIKEAEKLFSS